MRWSCAASMAAARSRRRAAQHEAVVELVDVGAHRPEPEHELPEPVGLLHPQLPGSGDPRLSGGLARHHRQERQLVQQRGNLGGEDLGPPESSLPAADPERGHRIAGARRLGLELHPRPHPLRAPTGSRSASGFTSTPRTTTLAPGTRSPAPTQNAAEDGSPGTSSASGSASGRRRRVDHHLAGLHPDRRTPGGEHPLGVVARRLGLADPRLAVGGQPGEDQRALHLCAGDGEPVRHAGQGRRRLDPERRTLVLRSALPLHPRAHRPERREHPAHRPAPERGITVEGAGTPAPRRRARAAAASSSRCSRSRADRPARVNPAGPTPRTVTGAGASRLHHATPPARGGTPPSSARRRRARGCGPASASSPSAPKSNARWEMDLSPGASTSASRRAARRTRTRTSGHGRRHGPADRRRHRAHAGHEVLELGEGERLRAVGERARRIRMDLDR